MNIVHAVARPIRALLGWPLITLTAAVLVALLAVVVIDNIRGENKSDNQLQQVIDDQAIALQELKRSGLRNDALAGELRSTAASRDRLSEEVRALREMLVDAQVIEPRPQQQASDVAPRPQPGEAPAETPRTGPGTPSQQPSARPSPGPSRSPAPGPSPTASPTPRPPTCALGPLPVICPGG